MSWLYLFLAGLAETGWAIGLKYTDGFTRLWPSVFTGLGMALSFVLLSIAMRNPASRHSLRDLDWNWGYRDSSVGHVAFCRACNYGSLRMLGADCHRHGRPQSSFTCLSLTCLSLKTFLDS
jgi:hypothetical protein